MQFPLEVVAALVSAVTSLAIMLSIEGIIRPAQRKKLRRELLQVWISDMKSDLEALESKEPTRRWERLVVDIRTLDRLALHYDDLSLVDKMTVIRSQILDFNKFIDFYDAMVAANYQSLAMPTQKLEGKDASVKKQAVLWAGPLFKERRDKLIPLIKEVKSLLEQALAREKDPS